MAPNKLICIRERRINYVRNLENENLGGIDREGTGQTKLDPKTKKKKKKIALKHREEFVSPKNPLKCKSFQTRSNCNRDSKLSKSKC